jgi:hypothetical protein
MELNTSYRLTRSQSLCGIRSTSAGNYPVVPVRFFFNFISKVLLSGLIQLLILPIIGEKY